MYELLLVLTVTVFGVRGDDPDLRQGLQATLDQFTEDLGEGNFSAAAMYFNVDGHLLLGGFPLVTGRQNISAKFEYFYNQGVRNTNVTSMEAEYMHVGPALMTAYDRGVWQLLSDDDKVLDEGVYLNVWARARDQHYWQIRDRVVVSTQPSSSKSFTALSPRSTMSFGSSFVELPSDPALLKVITQANEVFMEGFTSGNMANIAELYAVNGTLMPPHSPPQIGRDAIQATWQGVYNRGVRTLELTIAEVGILPSDQFAFEQSFYQLSLPNGTVVDQGKYIVIWTQLSSDSWELYLDCFNSNLNS